MDEMNLPQLKDFMMLRYTESLKGFEMKPLRVFSDSPRDKNLRGFPYE